MIECDCCNLWYHTQCQNLSKTEASLISEGADKGIIWLCTACKPTAIIKPKPTSKAESTDEKLEFIKDSIKKLQDKLEQNVNKVSTTPETSYRDALQSMKVVEESTKQQQILLQKSIENTENENRKVNAILYGLEETLDISVIDQVKEFMKKDCFVGLRTAEPVSAFRLGAKTNERVRPTKVKFINEDAKWVFLKRVNEQFKGTKTFCLLDRSKEIRDEEYKLRQVVKQLSSENVSQRFRTREMKIQVQHEGEWKNMKQGSTGTWVIANSKNTNI